MTFDVALWNCHINKNSFWCILQRSNNIRRNAGMKIWRFVGRLDSTHAILLFLFPLDVVVGSASEKERFVVNILKTGYKWIFFHHIKCMIPLYPNIIFEMSIIIQNNFVDPLIESISCHIPLILVPKYNVYFMQCWNACCIRNYQISVSQS